MGGGEPEEESDDEDGDTFGGGKGDSDVSHSADLQPLRPGHKGKVSPEVSTSGEGLSVPQGVPRIPSALSAGSSHNTALVSSFRQGTGGSFRVGRGASGGNPWHGHHPNQQPQPRPPLAVKSDMAPGSLRHTGDAQVIGKPAKARAPAALALRIQPQSLDSIRESAAQCLPRQVCVSVSPQVCRLAVLQVLSQGRRVLISGDGMAGMKQQGSTPTPAVAHQQGHADNHFMSSVNWDLAGTENPPGSDAALSGHSSGQPGASGALQSAFSADHLSGTDWLPHVRTGPGPQASWEAPDSRGGAPGSSGQVGSGFDRVEAGASSAAGSPTAGDLLLMEPMSPIQRNVSRGIGSFRGSVRDVRASLTLRKEAQA